MKNLLKSLFCLLMVFGLVAVITACDKTEPVDENEEKTVDVLSKFADDGSGTYTLTEGTAGDGEKTLVVAADKTNVAADKVANAALVADFTGTDLSNMNRLRFLVSGSCQIIIEISSGSNAVSVELALGSEESGHQWKLDGAEEQAILDAGNVKVSVYAMKGKSEGVATFTFSQMLFGDKKATYNVLKSGDTNIDPRFNNYDGTSSIFDVNDKWTPNDPGTYTTTKQEDGSVKVDYDITGWNYMYSPVDGAFGKFTYLTIKLTGVSGEGFTFKAEKSNGVVGKEAQYLFNGELQVVSIDLSEVDAQTRELIERVLIFATSTGNASKNSFVIHECYFGMEDETAIGEQPKPEEPEVVHHNAEIYWGGETWSPLGGDWYTAGDDVFTWDAETKTVSFAERTGYNWSVFGVDTRGNFGVFDTLTYEVTITKGLLVKFVVEYANGRQEYGWLDTDGDGQLECYETKGTGEKQTVTLPLSILSVDQRNSIKRIGFFAGWQLNEAEFKEDDTNNYFPSGSVQINSVTFSGYTAITSGADTFDINHSFFDISNPVCNYVPVTADGVTTVTVNKQADSKYAGFIMNFNGGLTGYTSLNYDLELGEGLSVVFKIEGAATPHEFTAITASGTGSIDLSAVSAELLASANRIVVFVNLGSDEGNGTVTINTLEFVK